MVVHFLEYDESNDTEAKNTSLQAVNIPGSDVFDYEDGRSKSCSNAAESGRYWWRRPHLEFLDLSFSSSIEIASMTLEQRQLNNFWQLLFSIIII